MKQKRKLGRKLLSFLLTLAMVVGLMPGMSLTAYADNTEELLTTLTFGGSSTYSETTSGVVSVTATNVLSYNDTYGWLFFDVGSLSVTAEEGYTINKCVFRQNNKQPITDTEAPFEIHFSDGCCTEDTNWDMDGVTSIEVYRYVTPTTVDVAGVSLNKTTTTLTVGDTETLTATVSPDDATDKTVKWSVGGTNADAVKLYTDAACTTEVGTDATSTLTVYAKGISAGSATVTAASNADNSKNAECAVTVNKADPTAPTGLTATYGQTLANVMLPAGWTWADSTQSVGSVVSTAATFKANFAGDDNYNAASNVDVTVTVSKADATAAMQAASVSIAGTSGKTATVSYTLPDGASYGAVTNSNTEFFTVDTTSGIVLTAAKNWTASDWATDTSKTFTVLVSGATNYNDYTLTVTVTPTYKATQTITAADVTATYGDTGKKIEASTSGDGALSYSVKSGDAVTVDASGNLTIVKAGTAVITVTAAETGTYAQATKEVTVTINKANAVPATVTANNRTYDGTEKSLVTVTGEPMGGTLYYALGENSTTAPADNLYTTSIPAKTEAGTYYVWYKVVGDDAHADSEAKCITVTISEALKIEFKANGGTGTMDDQKVTKNETTKLKTHTFTREDHSFKDWNTREDGSGTSYSDNAEVTLNENLILYAQWSKVEKHNHNFEKVEAVEAGCESDGNKSYYRCTDENCDEWYEDASLSVRITDKSSVILKATGHKWDKVEITKEATYDEEGIRTYTCSVCGETKTESIKKKERPSSYDDSDDSSSDDSDSGSSSSSGSSSKRYTEAQAKVDQINNVSTYSIPENHQVESGVPASDVGGRWGNNANADTWTYTKSNGTLAKSEWMSLDYNGLRYWYYFNDDGNMHTNWFDYKGERFYLMPDKDGWRGRMATGWKNIENKWYYFDIVPGSSQGRLYRSTVTPDGHTVGADGAWNGVGATPVGQE